MISYEMHKKVQDIADNWREKYESSRITINKMQTLINALNVEKAELQSKADCPKGWHYSEVVALQEKYDDACRQLTKAHETIDQLYEQVTMLRKTILKRMASENRWPDYIQEALAATESKE